MEVIITKTPEEGSQKAYEIIRQALDNGAEVFGLATGSTPEATYQLLAESDVDFSDKISINLDEYVGLDADHPQSYHYFMNEHLLSKKPFKESYVPEGELDEESACKSYDAIIEKYPIDFQLLGIGPNGHIGFNEPGTPFDSTTHRVDLAKETIEANKRFFDSIEEVPKEAYTMGMASIMSAKQILLLAWGEGKAQAIKAAVEGPVTEEVPASLIQEHPNAIFIIDEEAASLLERKD